MKGVCYLYEKKMFATYIYSILRGVALLGLALLECALLFFALLCFALPGVTCDTRALE